MFFLAILIASVVWFLVAAVLFFNPITDKVYRSEEQHAAVRTLPQKPKTIGMILAAILVQSALWALVYRLIAPAFSGEFLNDKLSKGLLFGLILVFTKIIPRDVDRLLLTTYPKKRMTIEFVIGIICSFAVGITFGYVL